MKKTTHKPSGKIQYIATEDLNFDPDNPRFYRLNDPSSVTAVIEEMFDDEGVQELMLSIGEKDYFEGEPLLVATDKGGSLIVIEGNRRLAATKLLNGEIPPPKRRTKSVETIRSEAKFHPNELPCIAYDSRKAVLRYLGYRHITGVKPWDSLSKAKYLAQLRDDFYDAEPRLKQLKALANDIGSTPNYVGKLLTALSLYTYAEDRKFFKLGIRSDDIEFSYITTALNYNQIVGWLGLTSSVDIDMPKLLEGNLQSAFAWMFAKDQTGKTIIGESRNLRTLACIVDSEDAIKVLEDTGNLGEAFLYTDGPQVALQRAMEQAQVKLQTIWGMLPKTRPLTEEHAAMAQDLFEVSKDSRNYIREKLDGE